MHFSFIMLKPDALKRELVDQILQYFARENIQIERVSCRIGNEALISQHYAEVIGKMGADFKNKLMMYIDGQLVMPILLKSDRPGVIDRVRKIVGATNPADADSGTIRGDLGIDSYEKCNSENRSCENLIHASDSPNAVLREIEIWFGETVAEEYKPYI